MGTQDEEDQAELRSAQTIEAYRTLRSASFHSEKQLYQLNEALAGARRSNGLLVEELHKARDTIAILQAELDASKGTRTTYSIVDKTRARKKAAK